jgi:hypothetical protein
MSQFNKLLTCVSQRSRVPILKITAIEKNLQKKWSNRAFAYFTFGQKCPY